MHQYSYCTILYVYLFLWCVLVLCSVLNTTRKYEYNTLLKIHHLLFPFHVFPSQHKLHKALNLLSVAGFTWCYKIILTARHRQSIKVVRLITLKGFSHATGTLLYQSTGTFLVLVCVCVCVCLTHSFPSVTGMMLSYRFSLSLRFCEQFCTHQLPLWLISLWTAFQLIHLQICNMLFYSSVPITFQVTTNVPIQK